MKTALVTGVTRGIGRAISLQLLSDGYEIVGTYVSSQQEAEDMLNLNDKLTLHQVDFSSREQTKTFIDKIRTQNFDIVVNNAGIILFETWDEFTMETWDKVMEVNLNTPMLIASSLKNSINDGGVIINIASTDGMMGSISSIAYSASKAALINLTKSLTNVFAAKQVRVNAIAPGWVGDGMDSPAIAEARWINPMGRTAKYEEIANVVSFLVSKKASYINGETIVVDGGSSAVDYVLKKESELTN